MPKRPHIVIAAFIALAAHASATAQLPKPQYEAVEQSVEDVSPLGVSLRSLQTGLGVPSGFESVYRLPSDGTRPGRLMRIDGGLAAIFPQSQYNDLILRERRFFIVRETKIGVIPVVPAGTVFKIGLDGLEPEPTALPVRTAQAVLPQPVVQRIRSDQAVYTTRPLTAPPRHATTAATSASSTSRIEPATSEVTAEETENGQEQREERMRALLRRAAQAETENGSAAASASAKQSEESE